MKKKFSLKAITLVELVVAISLLGMIMLTAATIELSMRKINLTTDLKVLLMNDLVYVKERIKRELLFATGDANTTPPTVPFLWNNTACPSGDRWLRIRIDSNLDAVWSAANDRISEFYWSGGATSCAQRPNGCSNQYDLCFYNDIADRNNVEIVAANISLFETGILGDGRRISIRVMKRKDPNAAINSITNPEMGVLFGISARQCPPLN